MPTMIATLPAAVGTNGTSDSAPRDAHRGSRASSPHDRGRVCLERLFAGEFLLGDPPAPPLPPEPRTPAEYDAVSRACGCRDLFVIHADPVTGERIIADIARAATDRVLIFTPNSDAADRITERLLNCGERVLRALADDENPARPSPAVSRATSASSGGERAQRDSASALAAAEQRLAAFAPVSKAVARLAEVRGHLEVKDAEAADLAARRDRIEAEVRAEAGTPYTAALAQLQAEHDAATARLSAELQELVARHAEKEAALSDARHQHAESNRKPGLLSRIFSGKPKPGAPDPAELDKRIDALEAEVAELASRASELRAKAEAGSHALASSRERLVAVEVAERRGKVNAALAALEEERQRSRAEADALNKVIADAVPGEDFAEAERELTETRRRVAEATAHLSAESRVVVGTPKSLTADPVFAALTADPPFGLLVLDRAEELAEADFTWLSRLAGRWVLVGEAVPHQAPRHSNGRGSHRNGRAPELPFVARVARRLDRETWVAEGERLVCRLAHLTPRQRRAMAREPLADRPEIELRFAASEADGEPVLAEIAFPAEIGTHAAKSFLFNTLGEVLLRPCGEVNWTHEADAITATWPAADSADGLWIDLEPGVREKVTGAGAFAFTSAVRFDPTAGWDAEKAAAWLAYCLPPPATGRFAALPRAAWPRHS